MRPGRFGNYSVLRKIASGGMSDVYLCRLRGEAGFEKRAAVKVIHPRLSASAHFRELFVREARIAASLSHPNLVPVFDFGREGDLLFLAMEYVAGWNLAQAAAQIRIRPAPVPLPVWRAWTEGIVEGLGYLHSRGIVHRDMSPSNVLVSRDGAVRIADFGIASIDPEGEPGRTGWEGKAAYLSPERARTGEAGVSSDLFAAALVAAELFLPGRLFEGDDPEDTLARVRDHSRERVPARFFPPEVSAVLLRALSPDPGERYPDAAGFSRAVTAAVPGYPTRAEHAAFFDRLFPAVDPEEETVPAPADPAPGAADRVREPRGGYGPASGRRIGAGIAAGIAAVSLGTVLYLGAAKKRPAQEPAHPPSSGEPDSAAAASSPAAVSPTLPPAPDRAGKAVSDAARRERAVGSPGQRSPEAAEGPRAVPGPPAPPSAQGARGVLLETDPGGVSVALEEGTPLGKTPLRLDPSAWEGRTLLLRMEGYEDRTIPASALATLSAFRIEMERETGVLPVLQAIPWARVYDGDRYLGVTPIPSLRLPVGPRRLRFVNEALGVDRIETVEVRAGENPKVIVPLVRVEEAD